jgi:hypothetical protein
MRNPVKQPVYSYRRWKEKQDREEQWQKMMEARREAETIYASAFAWAFVLLGVGAIFYHFFR